MTASTRHFLDLDAIDQADLRGMIDHAAAMKRGDAGTDQPLRGKYLAMIFEKPSTRTRVSFEVGMKQLGGDVVVLNPTILRFPVLNTAEMSFWNSSAEIPLYTHTRCVLGM